MSDAIFHNVNLRNARIRGAFLNDAEISGDITGMKVNGVLVAPLVEAELDRLYPERAKLYPDTPGRDEGDVVDHRGTVEGHGRASAEAARGEAP